MTRQQKITFAEMRASGVRNVLINCSDHRCGHFNIVPDDADRWPDELRISDIEDKFVCTACGVRGLTYGKRQADFREPQSPVRPLNLITPAYRVGN